MENQVNRSELLTEYYKLIDMLQQYDTHFLSIKNWSVTLSSAAIGLSFVQSSAPSFIIAFFLALSFWIAETRFKMLQLNHTLRVAQLEEFLSKGKEIPSPLILHTFAEESARNNQIHRWRYVMFWSHVMVPHIFFVLISAGAGLIQTFF